MMQLEKDDVALVGCLLNGKAVTGIAADWEEDVVVCVGTGGYFSFDNFICAGKIVYDILLIRNGELDNRAHRVLLEYENPGHNLVSYLGRNLITSIWLL